jgi:tetratricopeptide (TPR) repeat protein
LTIHREIGNRQGEATQLGNLGGAYYNLGQFERAIDYYNQALTIHREIGNRQGEATQLGNLGIAYRNLSQLEKASQCLKLAIYILKEINSSKAELYQSWLNDLEDIDAGNMSD